jgi:hypothetical protein
MCHILLSIYHKSDYFICKIYLSQKNKPTQNNRIFFLYLIISIKSRYKIPFNIKPVKMKDLYIKTDIFTFISISRSFLHLMFADKILEEMEVHICVQLFYPQIFPV